MKRVWKAVKAILPWRKKTESKGAETAAPLKRKPAARKAPVILSRDKHSVSRKNIDADALKVLYRLKRFGHESYLVGGGVRDLMLGLPAKDYDISTAARPGQVKKIFSNCRLVGRRFRLAHILFRGKFIEVATFRKESEYDLDEKEDLLIKSDNTYGTPEEDAFRRDFTINGLFYSLTDFSVIDYVDGLRDLRLKVIRCIGDPNIRFREDPIRMLRAIRLAARLGFTIEEEALAAISAHRSEIWKGATPRILEELQRMLREGYARRAMGLLLETGLMEMLLPELTIVLVRRGQAPLLWSYLEAADRLAAEGSEFTFPVLYAALMTPLFKSKLENTKGPLNFGALVEETIHPIAERLGMPKKHIDRAKSVLAAQRRFPAIVKKGFQPGPLFGRPYFHEALDLFRIHAAAQPEYQEAFEQWRQLSGRHPHPHQADLESAPGRQEHAQDAPGRREHAQGPPDRPEGDRPPGTPASRKRHGRRRPRRAHEPRH